MDSIPVEWRIHCIDHQQLDDAIETAVKELESLQADDINEDFVQSLQKGED